MKKGFCFLLAALLLTSLWACGSQPAVTETAVSFPYPTIHEKLTWEAIDAFPVKTSHMTTEEMRQLCVDFFRFSKSVLWIPDADQTFVMTGSGGTDELYKGVVYGGLPYVASGCGNVYRMMDYIDESTGLLDIAGAMEEPRAFGNQCSFATHWAWARVVNSAKFGGTNGMVEKNGFLPVGPYTYDPQLQDYMKSGVSTGQIIRDNGAETMFQSYAAMKLADGLVTFENEAGHVIMCTGEPVVVYRDDGTVDGAQSYLLISDQTTAWEQTTNEAGDTCRVKAGVDKKKTFFQLLEDGYIPFTFAEFLGEDPVEDTVCAFSHQGTTVSFFQLCAASVSANYSISDVYLQVTDGEGTQLESWVVRSARGGICELPLKTFAEEDWGKYTDGGYTLEVKCRLSTGELLRIYTGTIVN